MINTKIQKTSIKRKKENNYYVINYVIMTFLDGIKVLRMIFPKYGGKRGKKNGEKRACTSEKNIRKERGKRVKEAF